MAPRKIKVVDLVTDNIEETVCEKVEDEKICLESQDEKPRLALGQAQDEKIIEPIIEKQVFNSFNDDETQTLKVRTNQLHECPKCKKMMTQKTLRYSHEKTCGITKDSKKLPKTKEKEEIETQEIEEIEEIPSVIRDTRSSEAPKKLKPKPKAKIEICPLSPDQGQIQSEIELPKKIKPKQTIIQPEPIKTFRTED